MIAIPRRRVITSMTPPVCFVEISQDDSQDIGVDFTVASTQEVGIDFTAASTQGLGVSFDVASSQGVTISYAVASSQNIRVSFMECCVKRINPCIAQGSDKVFSFIDSVSVDYSLASQITFDVWENIGSGSSLISKSLTGGDITLVNDYTFTLSISDTESGNLTPGSKYCEVWVTSIGGELNLVGAGPFTVIDTKKFD